MKISRKPRTPPKANFGIKILAADASALEAIAEARGVSRNQIVSYAIKVFLIANSPHLEKQKPQVAA